MACLTKPKRMLHELFDRKKTKQFITYDYAKKLEEKQWHLGDIVEDDEGHRAMIIQDDNYFYELMKIKDEGAFKTFRYFDISGTLNDLQNENPEWHKVVEDK